MCFGFSNRRVLAAGLVLSLIFITVCTSNFAGGAETQREPVATKERSRLHPKRMYSGLKRGISKLFGRSKKEEAPVVQTRPTTPGPTVSQKIDNRYAEQGVRYPLPAAPTTQQPFVKRAPLPVRPVPKTVSAPVVSPKRQIITDVKQSLPPVKKQILFAAEEVADKAAEEISFDENPFADIDFSKDFDFDKPFDQKNKVASKLPAKQTAPKTVMQASAAPKAAPPINHLLGYCPVNLKLGKFQRGKPQFKHVYQGRSYTFDSQAALNEFIRNPVLYAPVLQGVDVIELQRTGRHVEGFLSFSCDFDGHFYLFRTAANQEAFLANPATYAVTQ